MSELTLLCNQLAKGTIFSPAGLHQFFQCIGCRGDATALPTLLKLISDAGEDFKFVGMQYPSSRPWINLFLMAPKVLKDLKSLTTFSPSSVRGTEDCLHDLPQVARFCDILEKRSTHLGNPIYQRIAAATYLIAVMRQASDQHIPELENKEQPDKWLFELVDMLDLMNPIRPDLQEIMATENKNLFLQLGSVVEELLPSQLSKSQTEFKALSLSRYLSNLNKLLVSTGAAKLGYTVESSFQALYSVETSISTTGDSKSSRDEEPSEPNDDFEPEIPDDVQDSLNSQTTSQEPSTSNENQKRQGWKWGDRPSSRLSERAILPEHRRAMRPSDQKSLASLARHSLLNPPKIVPGMRPPSPGFHEGIIIAVALVLGKSIKEACTTRIIGYRKFWSDEYPIIELKEKCLFVGHDDPLKSSTMVYGYASLDQCDPNIHDMYSFLLPQPEELIARINQLAPDIADAQLQELLPYIPEGWEVRTSNWLSSKFDCSIAESNLAIKHALSRDLHARTANRALIDFLSGNLADSKAKKERRSAIGSYVYAGSQRDKTEYLASAHNLLGAPELTPLYFSAPDFRFVPREVLRRLSQNLGNKVRNPHQSFIERHNAFAIYTLTLLVLATGHRYSESLLHFPWDFDIDASLAFLCDKLIVGSEARFVPLPKVAVNQIIAYRKNVAALVKELSTDEPKLAQQIASAAGFVFSAGDEQIATSTSHPIGQFFLIENGLLRSITSADIDAKCLQAISEDPVSALILRHTPGPDSFTKRLRRNIATYLWTSGMSGLKIEAMLGHNRQWHIYGEASVWNVMRDTADLQDCVGRYLDDASWTTLDISPSTVSPTMRIPLGLLGCDGYEGRERSRLFALSKAVSAVRRAILLHIGSSEASITLSDEDVAAIRDVAAESLGSDTAARDKILQAISEFSGSKSVIGEIKFSASKINQLRTEAGPVELDFARNCAIANSIRKEWKNAVEQLLLNAHLSRKDSSAMRVAVLASSLIIHDAILDPRQLWSLLEATWLHKVTNAFGRIQIRTQVETTTAFCSRVIYLTRISSATVIGLLRAFPLCPNVDATLNRTEVEEHIRTILDNIVRFDSSHTWGISSLSKTFRSWWFLRLPGFIYSIAVGRHDAPSADVISEATLLGAKPNRISNLAKQISRHSSSTRDELMESAHKEVSSLFGTARGSQTDGAQASKAQRARLRAEFEHGLSADLVSLMNQFPIVQIRLEFIEHILKNGGLDSDTLAFNTIFGYDNRLKTLYDNWWTLDAREFTSDEFDANYQRLIDQVKDSKDNNDSSKLDLMLTALRTFHWFLRTKYRASPSKVIDISFRKSCKRHPRSSLLAPRLFDSVLRTAKKLVGKRSEIAQAASNFLMIGHAFGTRQKEALYSLVSDFDTSGETLRMKVQSNSANKLKNPKAGTREIPFPFATSKIVALVRGAINAEAEAALKRRHLFSDPTDASKLLDFSLIAKVAIAALKIESGNYKIDNHGQRHTYTTRQLLAVTPSVGSVAAIKKIRVELAPDRETAFAIQQLAPNLTQWPFFVDRVGMWLGNAGVDNLLDVYFHGGTWILAEQTDSYSMDDEFLPAHWAALMKMTRTNLVHLRNNWKKREGVGTDVSNERMIGHFIDLLNIPSAVDLANLSAGTTLEEDKSAQFVPLTLAMADRLLVKRHEDSLTIAEAVDYSVREWRLNKSSVQQFFAGYKDALADTELFDYEPKVSEISLSNRSNRAGVWRNSTTRQDLLSRIEVSFRAEAFQSEVTSVVGSWKAWLNRKNPMLIARTVEGLQRLLKFLDGMGIPAVNRNLFVTNSMTGPDDSFGEEQLVFNRSVENRFSRGDRHVSIGEFGVEIRGDAETSVVRNADFHRAMLVLCSMQLAKQITP